MLICCLFLANKPAESTEVVRSLESASVASSRTLGSCVLVELLRTWKIFQKVERICAARLNRGMKAPGNRWLASERHTSTAHPHAAPVPCMSADKTPEFIPTSSSLLGRLKNWDDQASWQRFADTYHKLIYKTALKAGLTEA